MFKESSSHDNLGALWNNAREVQDQYKKVLHDIQNRLISSENFESFLLLVVSHATAIQLAGKRANSRNQLPIEAVTTDNHYRNLFTTSCVAYGFTSHAEIAQIWKNCEKRVHEMMQ